MTCAKHNAEIYDVQDMITWYHGDCFKILQSELKNIARHSVIFASPPWGGKTFERPPNLLFLNREGPSYRFQEVFDLSKTEPYSISDILNPLLNLTDDLVLYLPRTSDVRQIVSHLGDKSKIIVMHYCMEGASKVSEHTLI